MASPKDDIIEEIQNKIDSELVGDRHIPWTDCIEGLEELIEHCNDWIKSIKEDNENSESDDGNDEDDEG